MLRLVIENEDVHLTNGKIMVSRELLGTLLEHLETRAELAPLSPRERESLEQLVVAVMSEEEEEEAEITIPGELAELWHTSG